AHRIAKSLAGRIWFVPLVDLRTAAELPKALVTALSLPHSAAVEPLAQAIQALSRPAGADGSTALLIFDNMEHLLAGCGDREVSQILAALVGQVPGLRCLVAPRRRRGGAAGLGG